MKLVDQIHGNEFNEKNPSKIGKKRNQKNRSQSLKMKSFFKINEPSFPVDLCFNRKVQRLLEKNESENQIQCG